jgi:hypothetical protein
MKRAQFSNPAWRPENFDKLAGNFLAGVQLASALILLN